MRSRSDLRTVFALLLGLCVAGLSAQPRPAAFDAYFTASTMRVDYFHTGGLGSEVVALDRVLSDGAWPGSRTKLVDSTSLGNYLFEVIDPQTNQVIYSR